LKRRILTSSREKENRKLKHGAESLLHTLSDQQIVTGIALIIATEKKACQISAYHYNLVCVMMLMSMITHLNTMINITQFFRKGYLVGSLRFISISATMVYTGILFQSRNTPWFPRDAGTLSILPAACFENKNGSQGLGFHQYISDVTSNKTMAADRLAGGFTQYMILSTFCVFAIVMLGIYSLEPCLGSPPGQGRRWVSLGLRVLSTFITSMIVIYAVVKYTQLRNNMEVEKWYQVGQKDTWTFSQLLPYVLLGSSGIAVMKALDGMSYLHSMKVRQHLNLTTSAETIGGPRGSRHNKGRKEVKADDEYFSATLRLKRTFDEGMQY